jgi:hypothetical protein
LQSDRNVIPIFKLGEGFQLNLMIFNEANYYYEIIHCDYNWVATQKTNICKDLTIKEFKITQIHSTPCKSTRTIKYRFPTSLHSNCASGNYILKVLDEKRRSFSRKFILYEDLATVPMQVKRARTVNSIEMKHNLEFSIKSNQITFQNPMKMFAWCCYKTDNLILSKNIVPQYTIGNDLV